MGFRKVVAGQIRVVTKCLAGQAGEDLSNLGAHDRAIRQAVKVFY
jgi:hypothetical protein